MEYIPTLESYFQAILLCKPALDFDSQQQESAELFQPWIDFLG